MKETEYKKRADLAIKNLESLLQCHRIIIEKWQDSEYCYTDEGREIIQTSESMIKEIESEIAAFEQYKATGVWISRKARKALEEIKRTKEER